ncbi:MAG: hypothetical protein PHQ43_00790 [Dehalococcoidales bacterium]|nr:hypothetical protein [Dehalococcoidales bacterium]
MAKTKRVKLPAPHVFTGQEDAELIGYFHLAKTALASSDAGKRYNRLVWSAMQFNRKHPKVSRTRAYIRIDNLTKN